MPRLPCAGWLPPRACLSFAPQPAGASGRAPPPPSHVLLACSRPHGGRAGYFILKTLTEVRGSATLTPEVMKQNYCIFALAGMQFVFTWYLAAT